ncbi:hypothetical protein [Bauldia sp.]|uniref:hypothetical protein n=1 Tax=Bauldia sp. TaxID=2575872 RepID=UPI003BAA26B9
MRMLSKLVLLSTIVVSGAAVAEDSVPDLRGTWVVIGEGMRIDTADKTSIPLDTESTVVIDWQEGSRISGYEVDQKSVNDAPDPAMADEVIAGVFGPDNIVYMTDENGFRDCWIESAETMRCVYRHALADRTVVSFGVWTKQPQ